MRIESLKLVVDLHQNSELPFLLEEESKILLEKVGGRRHLSGVPNDASPELARVVVISDSLHLGIGFSRIDCTFLAPSHVSGSLDESMRFFQEATSKYFVPLFKKIRVHQWIGGILDTAYPIKSSKSMRDAARIAATQTTTVDKNLDSLTAFRLFYGYKEGDYFKHFTLDGYEMKKFVGKKPNNLGVVQIKTSEGTLEEAGFQFILDVNNKPKFQRFNFEEEVSELLDEIHRFALEAPTIAKINNIV